MTQAPFEAWTPAFGVRAMVAGNFVRLHVQDSGGRGYPHVVIVVRVKRHDKQRDRLRMTDKHGNPLEEVNGESLEHACVYLHHNTSGHGSRLQTVSPYLFKVPIENWPKDAAQLLVLLLYLQARGIGGRTRPPRQRQAPAGPSGAPSRRHHEDQAALMDEVTEAIGHALAHDTVDDLRGGLIQGTLGGLGGKAARGEADQPSHVTFAVGSCLHPSDILDRMPDDEHATRGPADASLLALGDLLDGRADDPLLALGAPSLLLLAGDQVYIDATGGLFDPKVLDEKFRIPYERRGQSRGVRAVMQRLGVRVEMMLDDHEIKDNWAPNDPEPEKRDRNNADGDKTTIERGKEAYFKYERGLQRAPAHLWHAFYHRGFPFFIGDTRTDREARDALNWRHARIMKPEQFDKLRDWLAKPRHSSLPKLVLTASALLPRRLAVTEYPASALHSEGWDGFPCSLHALLKFACDNEIKGLVFLSGDDHLSNVVTATVTRDDGRRCTLHSIHSSSLYAPYPFVNGAPEDFKAHESFSFSDPEEPWTIRYTCEVVTHFFPGDGFAVIEAHRNAQRWDASVRFYDTCGAQKNEDFPLDLDL